MSKKIYYLWKDKHPADGKVHTYITDYIEVSKDRKKIWIDGYGFKECELLYQGYSKQECREWALKQFLSNNI